MFLFFTVLYFNRWQRYNDQREAYVIKLSKTSYQQQSKITVLEQRCSDLNKELTEVKKINDMLKRQEENKRDAALFSADQQLMQKDEEIVGAEVSIEGDERFSSDSWISASS